MSAETSITGAAEDRKPTLLPTELTTSSKDTVSHPPPSATNSTFNIFVGDLPANVSETQLREHFDQYGEIKSVNIIRDKTTGACKGSFLGLLPLHASLSCPFLPSSVCEEACLMLMT